MNEYFFYLNIKELEELIDSPRVKKKRGDKNHQPHKKNFQN